MAISLNTNLYHPSLSCGTKLYSGLKLQSPCLFATGRPNLTADFFSRINKSLQCGTRNSKPTRSRVGMMHIGTPRVPYRVPGAGTWQWVDLWNALPTKNSSMHLFNELAMNTGQSVEKINKDLSRMKRFNAQEALEYGLIDRIVRPRIKADAPRTDAGAGLG